MGRFTTPMIWRYHNTIMEITFRQKYLFSNALSLIGNEANRENLSTTRLLLFVH